MPKQFGSEDLPLQAEDWTNQPGEKVAPWRREDRERIERARAASTDGMDRDAANVLATELRRLTELHQAGAITAQELVVAARTALTGGRTMRE
jgi:hypothetical protein